MQWSISDTNVFLSTLNTSKVRNAFHIWNSFRKSKSTRKPQIKGLPTALSIEPTTSCNLRCPECPSGLRSFSRPTGMLSQKIFRKVIDELENVLMSLTFYFQGEPYLNPDFLQMVEYAHRKKIYTITSTNAHYLDSENARRTVESGLSRLIISIDGTTQETYSSYRIGGSLQKVLDGARNVLAWKKKLRSQTPHVIFQFLVVRPNEHQIEEVSKLAKEMGVDQIKFKSAQIYDYENGSPLIPENQKYSRYKRNSNGTYQIKNKLEDRCWRMWHSAVVTWDGKVLPCCFDKDGKYTLGNISEHSFSEVWKNPAYDNFREKLLIGRSEIEICKNCSEGSPVWVK